MEAPDKLTIFIVAGRLGKSLVETKTLPLLETGRIKKIYIFRQEEGFSIEGAEYITIPRFILKIKPGFLQRIIRFAYEPLQLLWHTWKKKPDIINGIFTLPKGLNSVVVGKICNVKTIVSVIGGIVEISTGLPFPHFWKSINIRMLKTCSAATTTGSKVEKYLVNHGITAEKLFVYPGCIKTKVFSVRENVERDIDILFVGTFRNLKGPDRVLNVINNLVKHGLKIKASFLGTGYLFDEVKEKTMFLNLQEHVTFHGYINDPSPFFQRSKLLLMPSRSEGLPMAMLEAMASGCVPIVSNVGNISDVAKERRNAVLIENYLDIESFTQNARELLINDSLREKMSLLAVQTILNNYTPGKQAEVIHDVFNYMGCN